MAIQLLYDSIDVDAIFEESKSIENKVKVTFDSVNPKLFTVYPIRLLDVNDINFDNISSYLSVQLCDLVNDSTNKVFFLLFMPSEGPEIHWNDYYILKELKKLDDSKLIDSSKILFVYGDQKFESIIKEVYLNKPELKTNIPIQNFYSYNFVERVVSNYTTYRRELRPDRYVINQLSLQEGKIGNKFLKKHFIYKNGMMRPGRVLTLMYLSVNNLLDKCNYSVLAQNDSYQKYNDKEHFYSLLDNFTTDKDAYWNHYQQLELPIVIDLPQQNYKDRNGKLFPEEITKTSAVEIVVETCTNHDNDEGLNVTEKSFFPIFYRLPFITLGPPGWYSYMRSRGYETFPMLFNEDFDNELDFKKRALLFCKELKRFANTPIEDIQKIINSDEVQKIVKSNFDNLHSQVVNESSKLEQDFFTRFY